METLQQQQQQQQQNHGKKFAASSSGGLDLSNAQQQHPKYAVMIRDAIVSTKQRKGASALSIAKAIHSKHKGQLPNNFRKMLTLQLRKLVRSGRLVKVQSKYRCTPSFKRNVLAKTTLVVNKKGKQSRRAPPRRPASRAQRKRSSSRKRQRRSHSRALKPAKKRTTKTKKKSKKTAKSRRSTKQRSRSSSMSKSRRPVASRNKKRKPAHNARNVRKRGRKYY